MCGVIKFSLKNLTFGSLLAPLWHPSLTLGHLNATRDGKQRYQKMILGENPKHDIVLDVLYEVLFQTYCINHIVLDILH